MTDDRMDDVDVFLPPELKGAIDARLGYGDARSEWIREACRQRLQREAAEDIGITTDD